MYRYMNCNAIMSVIKYFEIICDVVDHQRYLMFTEFHKLRETLILPEYQLEDR